MKPQVTRQAENEQGVDTVESTSSRKKVSKRSFLAKDKSEAERMEEAAGGRYTLLGGANGNIDFDYVFGDNEHVDKAMAIFGFHTKVGNVANTILNDKEEAGGPDDAAGAIKDFLTQLATGVWAERSTGVAGQRVDKPALGGSVVAVMLANKLITPDQEGATYAKVLEKLETDPVYVRNCRQVPAVATEYNTRVGKAAKTVDSLMI